tara:strand:+ start:3562 stop:4560 length:999 start_codon:yes stop_codon:yes gene_type:complete
MKMKSFSGGSLPDAMAQVRQVFGDDAVILDTQKIEGGGIRVTAAVEADPGDRISQTIETTGAVVAELGDVLEYHRVPMALADKLMAAAAALLDEQPEIMLAGALDYLLRFGALPGERHQTGSSIPRRPVMMLGPPGSGKSATAAKICARHRVAGEAVRLISMDTVTAGAREQAQAYAQALDIPLVMAGDVDALSDALEAAGSKELVVIDTVGINPFDDADRDHLCLSLNASGADGVVILAAGGDALESAETATAFAECGARRLIATRIDAARRFGGILTAAQAGKLQLSALGISPSIGSGIISISPVKLARLLLPARDGQEEQNHLVAGLRR